MGDCCGAACLSPSASIFIVVASSSSDENLSSASHYAEARVLKWNSLAVTIGAQIFNLASLI